MLSNGFSTAASLVSLPILARCPAIRLQRLRLSAAGRGQFFIEFNRCRLPVLLLRHRSYVGRRVLGLRLKTLSNHEFSAWFLAMDHDSEVWRRLRVRFLWFDDKQAL